MIEVKLKAMSDEMYHDFFKEYENDMDLYASPEDYQYYSYDKETVDEYIKMNAFLKNKALAVVCGDQIVGEVIFRDIISDKCASLSIVMKNSKYTNQGIGTEAQRLALKYGFEVLNLKAVCAETLTSNTRSQHVMEKGGFKLVRSEDDYKYYAIERYMYA